MELTNGQIKVVDHVFRWTSRERDEFLAHVSAMPSLLDGNGLRASHWSCGCLNTYHPRFECPSMSESERAEHKARALGCSTAGEPLYEECLATQGEPIEPELEAANRTITVLREGIEKANAEIMRLRDELARRPAAFVEPESDKPNPFRDFTSDRRRMGPL